MSLHSKLWCIVALSLPLSEAKPRSACRSPRLPSFVVGLYATGVGISVRGCLKMLKPALRVRANL